MAKRKKKITKQERKEIRLSKAKQWIATYSGSPKKIVKNYKKRFKVDTICALNNLQAIGVEFTQEYLDAVKRSEQHRIQQKRLKKQQNSVDKWADSDDTFFFIAGYTSGGTPYGVTWEEMGLEPYEDIDEL